MKPEESIDFNIKVAWHGIYRMYNQEALRHDITTSIGFVLLNINSEEGTPATKIAPLMGLEARSLTRILKSMQSKGLIMKRKDPLDKRTVRICLTTEGLAKKERARETVKHFNQVIRSSIPQNKLNTFFQVIGKINALIDDNNIFTQVQSAHK